MTRTWTPELTLIAGGRNQRTIVSVPLRDLDELRIELATSKAERLAFTDAVRDLVNVAVSALVGESAATRYLERLRRRNEREVIRARSIDLGWECACGRAA